MIDATDRKILDMLQSNARVTNLDIANEIGMAPSAISERIKKLERKSLIKGYTTSINFEALGLGMTAFVFVNTNEKAGENLTAIELAKIDEVLEVHNVAGEDCYLIKVQVRDPGALGVLLREKIGAIPTVSSTRSTIVLETFKESSGVDIKCVPEPESE